MKDKSMHSVGIILVREFAFSDRFIIQGVYASFELAMTHAENHALAYHYSLRRKYATDTNHLRADYSASLTGNVMMRVEEHAVQL